MFKTRISFSQFRKLSSEVAKSHLKHDSSLPLVSSESSYTLNKQQILEMCKILPQLSTYSDELWYRSHETFTNYGIKTYNFLQIISKYPELLSRNPKQIVCSLELWRNCQFGEKLQFQLIQKYPNLLDIDNNDDGLKLLKKTTLLRTYVSTNKNVWKLLMNTPNLIKDNDKLIKDKFNYLIDIMKIDIPEICKSEVFSKTLDEIKCRHIFCERLGIFKVRSKKIELNEQQTIMNNNPKLSQIMDSSDKTFATKICKITIDEYEAFKQLFKRELENEINENKNLSDDDDDDDDYDDDNRKI